MEIADYRVTPIAFGDPPLLAASGLHAPWALRTIVEVVSNDGISGVSETQGGSAVVDDLLAVGDLVVGRDPFQLAELQHRLSPSPRTFGAIEVACLDLLGKAGVLPPDEEVRTIKLLREAFGPDIPLRIDPNTAWSLETSLRCASELEGLLEYYEDPVAGREDMAALARACNIPLATNMCCVSFADLPRTIELGSVSIVLGDHHLWGGLRASVELARICRTWNIGLSMHSNSHMAISLAAMTHLAAVVPNLSYACDTHYPWQAEEIVVGGKLRFEDGALPVPTGPGLGVELDRAQLERMHAQYLAAGIGHRDDEIGMQKVEPGWKRKLPRW
jgi:glucarate dehydratase